MFAPCLIVGCLVSYMIGVISLGGLFCSGCVLADM